MFEQECFHNFHTPVAVLSCKNALQFSRSFTPDLPGKRLYQNDLGLLLEELLDVQTKWYNLGLQLNFTVSTQDRIETQFTDPRDRLLEMLKTWLNSGYNPSWKTLTDALRSRNVGESQLAGLLEAKYCRPKDMHESKH